MALREIVTVPAPVLRRKAHKVTQFGPELQTLIDDMVETMRAAPGVGLAAPQVDVPLRVIVVEYSEEEDMEAAEMAEANGAGNTPAAVTGAAEPPPAKPAAPPKLYAVVNPEIVRASGEKELGAEGCLSIPGYLGNVERPVEILVKGQNRRGQPLRIKAEGWLARIFQHEIDHLNGVLFTDRAEKIWQPEKQPAATPSIGD
jgi:peptide deformylase